MIILECVQKCTDCKILIFVYYKAEVSDVMGTINLGSGFLKVPKI